MDSFVEKIFLDELIRQSNYAIAALERMNTLLLGEQTEEFFHQTEDFLQHCSAVSRLLWPPKTERAKNRGKYLRASLEVHGDHILKDRRLRNYLVHYDESIDNWAETSQQKSIIINNIGPRSMISAFKDEDIMTHYDPGTKQFIFRGEAFNVQEIVDGVIDILKRAEHRLQSIEKLRRS